MTPGQPDTRSKSEKLKSRAEVPLGASSDAMKKILGDDHRLYLAAEKVRQELNRLISELQEAERPRTAKKK